MMNIIDLNSRRSAAERRAERRAYPLEWQADNVGTEQPPHRPIRVSAIALSIFTIIGLGIIAAVFLINLGLSFLTER